MNKRLFYVEFRRAGDPVDFITVSAFTIDHALQVANAWLRGKSSAAVVWEIRAEPKRGVDYTEAL